MIKTREQLRADADADVAEFAELIASSQSDSTGIPRPPKIETSEIALDVTPFNFGIIEEPEIEIFTGPVTPFICPTVGTITVTFSGIIIDCGCVTFPIGAAIGSATVTDISINGTFILIGGAGLWTNALCGGLHETSYALAACVGIPISDTNEQAAVTVFCASSGFTIQYAFGSALFFASVNSPTISGCPNQLTACGQPFFEFGLQGAVGHGGTVTLSY